MTKIFEKANDQHVRTIVFYGKAADSKLYYESAYTTQVTQADLERAFLLGCVLIKDSTTYRVPVSLAGNKAKTIDVTTVSSTATPSFVEWLAAATAAE